MRKFVPLADRVLVKPDGVEQAKVPTRGLATPQAQKEEPTEGVVVAVGPLARPPRQPNGQDNGSLSEAITYALGIRRGMRVQWAKYSGREVLHNGEKHRLLRLEEIDGVIVIVDE